MGRWPSRIGIALLCVSSYLGFKSARARRIFEGEPLIVVQDGKPIERNLKEERLTLDDVMEEDAATRSRISMRSRSPSSKRAGMSFIKRQRGPQPRRARRDGFHLRSREQKTAARVAAPL